MSLLPISLSENFKIYDTRNGKMTVSPRKYHFRNYQEINYEHSKRNNININITHYYK